MNTMKKCLFGGALIGAGLCSNADAGHVEWTGGLASTTAYGGVAVGTFGTDWSAVAYGGYTDFAYAIGTTDGFSMGAYSVGVFAFSDLIGTTFTVDADSSFTFEWSASGFSDVSFDITGLGVINPDLNSVSGSGMFELTFLAGETYTMDIALSAIGAGFGFSGPALFTMTENTVAVVPLPPAAFAGLGMLAGLGAYRRIRK